ncbi:hypothetical protein JP28_10130 [Gallibacterium anatis]|uniref:type VI secretion system lipoprotein TssJ n=1 Tax=Pasteurellaceae TaxID=712 RepID=UPI000531F7F5|nr:type VI secretion system lipoprotein TssJ [Gallibacterium anatis]KGQ43101.1 hypothetical protein JP28_10130 [Gallibacterium anatis]KGQ52994.1 hypothetical protein IO46_04635 [Gallibacterium anatis]KGQ59119.1 hypothetical protein IO45_07065 [Gallibacterium anatis]
MKSYQFILQVLLAVFISSQLSGCSGPLNAASKIGQVIMNPNIPVGKLDERPSTLSLTFLSEKDINENEEGEASSIQVQVVYLTEDSKLLESYYEQFSESQLDEILGKNYLDHQDYTIKPGDYKVIPDITLEEQNRYLGVIAYYSEPEKSQWRSVIKLDGKGHNYHVLIHLRRLEVEMMEYE